MAASVPPSILLTNDDGIESEGLVALERALGEIGVVTVVAPNQQRSASSRALSVNASIRFELMGTNRYAVHGTPADSVILALDQIFPEGRPPDLLMSGINKGPNLGHNVFYSGTVGAAAEGTLRGIPSVAMSLASRGPLRFEPAARFAAELGALILKGGLPRGVTLNVNVPGDWVEGVQITRRGRFGRRAAHGPEPADSTAYRIDDEVNENRVQPDSDYDAIRRGVVSVTPLVFECDELPALRGLESRILSLRLPARK